MAEIKRILIANRGEIALRAIRTIKEMGKEAVAVYSTADKDASYLRLADATICIGGAKSGESYLHIPAIIAAAEVSECDAIFPGYGFLSENQNFVEICQFHDIKFIGPSVDVMALMSDKSKAKQVMKEAGVPVIPGSDGAVETVEEAKKLAKEMGFPVILKAAAGGGGRGMRVVEDESYVENAFLAAESEAITAFGDGTIYMEKFIENPRHIEVQVLADSHGNAVHIGERDCSMQRRHQKLIEESPAMFLDDETRAKLHEAAVKATKHIGYESAGTFEFLVDKHKNFYFMEMNTRLQVEHCVSEMVSGIDIIEWMIRIAEGERLFDQSDVRLEGHAIECRITAEDPVNFIPCPGKISKWIAPGGKDVRIDSHAHAGYIIPQHYDSMIGKVIVWDKDRARAIKKMRRAMDEFEIGGVKTVIDFHRRMMRNPDFIENRFDTKYLESHM
ncbi:acetyl-CoA carboxylase biotin carboxylase subunit [Hydrogenimonas cancrithermarum]|uniref:Biotin carboxylase n=1 Tax=Hydrogenimonas cancrithermarum TaxID=2993563 RepID=A0ABN6WVR8_9BACT|nr:acetyl-CoA carboxylase biotin carboxylase subunit [Hydrogenimonas cancrithermarum]BDY12839.1 acetyl-CoA carboxylase biotin carboxylase subunit [Hydrogenimonas cancrithermarum]BDY12956.1 acetyl-CoA carboxylase biotin carboxylase subunit [Hydrogenimonas cancrithermarum]